MTVRIFVKHIFLGLAFSLAAGVYGAPPRLQSQVFTGVPGRDDSQRLKRYCEALERIRPNLILDHAARVHGLITDVVGVPLKHSRVELRIYKSSRLQIPLTIAVTDEVGRFDLAEVPPGHYRLLASPNRGFMQPQNLECVGKRECGLDIKLIVPPHTDGPDSVCPVK